MDFFLVKILTATVEDLYTIGHFDDGVILLQLPEFISFSFSNAIFLIPVESKEQ